MAGTFVRYASWSPEAERRALVRERADATFTSIATAEGEIHGMPAEEVHLHEVGAVDAILDVVGVIWGFDQLGVERVYCGPIALGDGTVKAAHGLLPVPAPATLKLLEGHPVRPGPEGSGELVTPTGAALVRTLSSGPPPPEYVPREQWIWRRNQGLSRARERVAHHSRRCRATDRRRRMH